MATFLHPTMGAFAPRYERNNKKGGVKALKCFPTCAVAKGEHGRGTVCQDSVSVQVFDAPAFKGCEVIGLGRIVTEKAEMTEDAYFAGVEMYHVGEKYSKETLLRKIRSVEAPFNPEILGTFKPADRVVEFVSRGWHYGWSGGRYKTHQRHQFEAIIFIALPGEPEMFQCVSTLFGSQFEVYSSRRANPNDKFKRRTVRTTMDAAKEYAVKKESELVGQLMVFGQELTSIPTGNANDDDDDEEEEVDERMTQHGKRVAEVEYSKVRSQRNGGRSNESAKKQRLKVKTEEASFRFNLGEFTPASVFGGTPPTVKVDNSSNNNNNNINGFAIYNNQSSYTPMALGKMSPFAARADQLLGGSQQPHPYSFCDDDTKGGLSSINIPPLFPSQFQAPGTTVSDMVGDQSVIDIDAIDGLIADLVTLEDAFGIEFEEDVKNGAKVNQEDPLDLAVDITAPKKTTTATTKTGTSSSSSSNFLIPDLEGHSTPGDYNNSDIFAFEDDEKWIRDVKSMPALNAAPRKPATTATTTTSSTTTTTKPQTEMAVPKEEEKKPEVATVTAAPTPAAATTTTTPPALTSADHRRILKLLTKLLAWHQVATKCEAKKKRTKLNIYRRQIRYAQIRA